MTTLKFAAENKEIKQDSAKSEDWIVLIADDDEEVHFTTKRVLRDFTYIKRKVRFLHAHSAKETKEFVANNPNIAIILLDVVMEQNDSGLLLISYIREELKNDIVQIVIRTGQPGYAPEYRVTAKYAINDYLDKKDQTVQKLYNTLTTSLRSYNLMHSLRHEIKERESAEKKLRDYQEGLEKLVDERTNELKEANIALEASVRKAEYANSAKSDFLNSMSHEFRTPLHGILSFSGFGIEKSSTANKETILRYFTKIKDSAKRLLDLVNDLLDLAKLEAGKVVYKFRETKLSDIVRRTIDELDAYARKQNVSIIFVEPNFDDTANIDSAKIAQVIINLISNAIKFSNTGEEIQLKLANDTDSIIFSVSDTGLGIPVEERKYIFKKFVQSSKVKSDAKGTGLGLPICKRIIEDHKGDIWLEDHTEKGSIFKFKIPKLVNRRSENSSDTYLG